MKIATVDFIKIWNSSESLQEVFDRVQVMESKEDCTAKAAYLRKQGIPMKKFKRAINTNDELVKLAESVLDKPEDYRS